jgi:hypothetical protein
MCEEQDDINFTGMSRIMTFRSTTDRIDNGGPVR